ncbi:MULTISPECIES: hypothetical protein [Streptomyces]|uniref:EamA/RhaT family transporter n=1 Tax=Streptomyces lycii TaxID=2654337 RepID=A0ABQ7FFY8_9ACTN|nr:hypothetical protein [Streptomyces lycii]KAF4407448.1 hypothetical protein GCU69_19640 [Streptomyces lycii]
MSEPQQDRGGGPRPEPIRFFGTTWVDHDGGYALRRAGVALGALAAAAVGALLLRLGYQGLAIAEVGGFVSMLVVVMFAVCSALGFRHTWNGFTRRPEPAADPAGERSLQSLTTIGFIGTLLAWFCRALIEAPGEKLRRAEYERDRELYEKRRAARTGNPAAKAAAKRAAKRAGKSTGTGTGKGTGKGAGRR